MYVKAHSVPGIIAQACNPSRRGGRDRRIPMSPRPASDTQRVQDQYELHGLNLCKTTRTAIKSNKTKQNKTMQDDCPTLIFTYPTSTVILQAFLLDYYRIELFPRLNSFKCLNLL